MKKAWTASIELMVLACLMAVPATSFAGLASVVSDSMLKIPLDGAESATRQTGA
jgi:hypothetical protein